jgi:putative FmdB family regulatory protein
MPIYEYRCEECDEDFELFVRSASQKANPVCPKCGSKRVKKAVSLFGVGGTGKSQPSTASCGPSGST